MRENGQNTEKIPGDLRRRAVIQTPVKNHHLKLMWKICKIVDFAVPADHRIKLKEFEKKDKYPDLTRELKNYGTCRWQLYQL